MRKLLMMMAGITIMGIFTLATPAPLHALLEGSKQEACKAVNFSESGTCDPAAGNSVTKVVKVGLNILSIVVGVAAVIMIIIGGFKYVTSGGDSNNVSSAKSTIMYAVIGLVIVAMAQFIVRYVVNESQGAAPPSGGGVDGSFMLELFKKFMV